MTKKPYSVLKFEHFRNILNLMCKEKLTTGCPKKKDTVTVSHNFRLNYSNSKL